MRILALLMSALLLAGCSQGAGDPTGAVGSPAGDKGRDVALPANNTTIPGEPVLIDESGDIMGAFSQEWTWKTGTNVTRFDVSIDLTGPQGAPTGSMSNGVHAILVGSNGTVAEGGSMGNGISISIGGAECFLCYDGVRKQAPPGEWRLTLESEVAIAEFDVHVEVDY